jgi:hypothetical protein
MSSGAPNGRYTPGIRWHRSCVTVGHADVCMHEPTKPKSVGDGELE